MPGKLFTTFTDFANVPTTGTATANLPIGKTIEQILLQMGGGAFTKAMVSAVKIKANAKTIFDLSASQIDKLNAFRGHLATTTVIVIDFTEVFGRDLFDQIVGGFDTRGLASLSVEVTIAGATTPTLKMQVVQSAPQADAITSRFAGVISMVTRTAFNISAAGNLQIILPNGSSGALIKRIHIEHGVANNVTEARLKQGGIEVYQSNKVLNEAFLLHNRGVVQTNWYSMDFIVDENARNWLDATLAEQLELIPTFAAADSGSIIVESYNTLNRAS